jgi:hypothetical protein
MSVAARASSVQSSTVHLAENHQAGSGNEPHEIAALGVVADRGTGGAKQDAGVACLTVAAEIDGDFDGKIGGQFAIEHHFSPLR